MNQASSSPLDIFNYVPTPEEQRRKLIASLSELTLSPADLARHLERNRDYREFSATIRSIQRMIAGETRVSGEMMVIVNMLLRQHRRLKARYRDLKWERSEHGVYWAQLDDWFVYISPQTRGRWILSCRNGPGPKDYSPPFGRWLDSLEEAKNKALVCVEEGMNDLAEIGYEVR
ncbi:MAG: hypothetical protein E5Y88_30010 [Mesorhizobium sp.]|uniref:hypothetical protein n=1 Tax=Mesorhizobium sp. TaxID=1871066 RepID=UPI000FE7F69F|nr:hypothetical protein [Mesorhizobium sp.]RWD32149.1 MAG: hypothetical protein EOS34_21740 [Mesorhizobium sp.]RWO94240.1 MAG: hypothetical protein EOQ98_31760 [Mesorhizobium sp.]RWQ28855.1 MAG: hypothetical protein EOS20_33845 [Mesorhizobium sp.]RWQ42150.1 MAG: hypothetical protein EOS21_10195 [Mesorhizobium sp.]RWQ47401.1 MAG: hypothetical protein EOS83_27625 [Mesorhizobium sp.]